jgi:plasmid stability protein
MLGNLIREKLMAEAATRVLVAALRGETVPAPVAVEPETTHDLELDPKPEAQVDSQPNA